MDDARALLNSLMGNDRNNKESERKVRKFTDEENCRNYLLGLCPNDLFKNTKIDLGSCGMEHNDFLKEEFDEDPEAAIFKRKWRGPLQRQLRRLLEGVDRRTGSNRARIAQEKEGGPAGASEGQKQQITTLKEEVSEKLKAAEAAADAGRFDDSRNIIKDSDALKRQIEDLEAKRYEKYRKEEICEICGLIIDVEEQEANKTGRGWHIAGKQHIGYGLIREKLKELDKQQEEDKKNGLRTPSPSPEKKPDRSKESRRKSKSAARGLKRSRSPGRGESKRKKSRSPSKGRKVENRKRKVSRSKSRRRKASRSRSAAKHRKGEAKKSRSRSRKKKSRSRSRKKGRSNSRKKGGKNTKASSPKRKEKSPSPDSEKQKKKEEARRAASQERKKKKESKQEVAAPKPPNLDGEGVAGLGGEREKKAKDDQLPAAKLAEAKVVPEPPSALPPTPPPEPSAAADVAKEKEKQEQKEKEKQEQSARDRKAPVFMVFRPK